MLRLELGHLQELVPTTEGKVQLTFEVPLPDLPFPEEAAAFDKKARDDWMTKVLRRLTGGQYFTLDIYGYALQSTQHPTIDYNGNPLALDDGWVLNAHLPDGTPIEVMVAKPYWEAIRRTLYPPRPPRPLPEDPTRLDRLLSDDDPISP